MPWKETCPMDERRRFISDWMKEEWSVTELSRNHGISRKTAYKWLERFQANGSAGLADQSRAPHSHPNEVSEEVERAIVGLKGEHPFWGPKKLRSRLQKLNPGQSWPAASTTGEILKRNGLVGKRDRRRRVPVYKGKLCEGLSPNDVWAADFKGWFRTRDGSRVDPLTISDMASRYLLRCHSVERTDGSCVRAQFAAAFQEYGMPSVIRTDNGPPFASKSNMGLSRLAVWWVRLGITPERIRRGHPEENGVHERMHRTLKQETARPPQADPKRQQEAFDRFRATFNDERPHEALEMGTPSELYQRSNRPFPVKLPEIEYPQGTIVRRVRVNGSIKWVGKIFPVTRVLTGEMVGLSEIGNGQWAIEFGPLRLGVYDERKGRFDWK